jgi:hypothetical protein
VRRQVYTRDGTKYFKRGGAETTLPNKRNRQPRLGMDVAAAMRTLQVSDARDPTQTPTCAT